MKKRDLLFIAIILIIVGGMYALSLTGKKPPLMPEDATHTEATTKAQCNSCHGKGMKYARKPGHPFKDDCFMCHKKGGKMAVE